MLFSRPFSVTPGGVEWLRLPGCRVFWNTWVSAVSFVDCYAISGGIDFSSTAVDIEKELAGQDWRSFSDVF